MICGNRCNNSSRGSIRSRIRMCCRRITIIRIIIHTNTIASGRSRCRRIRRVVYFVVVATVVVSVAQVVALALVFVVVSAYCYYYLLAFVVLGWE